MIRILYFVIPLFLLSGCSTFFSSENNLDILDEKKVQASRKSEIIKDKKILMSMVVTHLNEVSVTAYYNREYFFVEIFQEDINDTLPLIDYSLNNQEPLWIREIKKDEFDKILSPSNKWSKCYLLAFKSLSNLGSRSMILKAKVASQGEMEFDFSFKTLPMQF